MKKAKTKASPSPLETKVARRKTEEHPTSTPPCILDSMPKEICHLILSRMPVRDAVRTSVLSKAWRARWRGATAVIFDESCIPRRPCNAPPSSYYAQLAGKYVRGSGGGGKMYTRGAQKAVNLWLTESSEVLDQLVAQDILSRVMQELQGPIEVIRLSLPLGLMVKDLLETLYNSAVRELVLDGCTLRLPAGLCDGEGFLNLSDLSVKGVVISADDLGGLISSCPSLSRLTLDIEDVKCLREMPFTVLVMSAPHLRHLEMRLGGLVWCIRLVAPQLVSATIRLHMFNGVRIHMPLPDGGCNLVHLLGESPQLEELTVTSLSLQFLCVGRIPSRLRQPLNRLERLVLNMNFNCPFHTQGALCLFTSSPTLKHVHIDSWSPSAPCTGLAHIWDAAGNSCSFPGLKHLLINRLSGMDSEIAFMRFVLLNAPVLAVLDIKKPRRLDITSLRHLVLNRLQDLLALRSGMTRITIY